MTELDLGMTKEVLDNFITFPYWLSKYSYEVCSSRYALFARTVLQRLPDFQYEIHLKISLCS
jgi:hypothetical protein